MVIDYNILILCKLTGCCLPRIIQSTNIISDLNIYVYFKYIVHIPSRSVCPLHSLEKTIKYNNSSFFMSLELASHSKMLGYFLFDHKTE